VLHVACHSSFCCHPFMSHPFRLSKSLEAVVLFKCDCCCLWASVYVNVSYVNVAVLCASERRNSQPHTIMSAAAEEPPMSPGSIERHHRQRVQEVCPMYSPGFEG
jgi:hypothetical protein